MPEGIVPAVRQRIEPECVVSGRLVKAGCRISLRDAPARRLVLDLDNPEAPTRPGGGRCDFLLVAENFENSNWIAPIECKRGSLDASTVVRQLRNGAAVAEEVVPAERDFEFRPIAAVGSVPKSERLRLRRPDNLIECRGKREGVRLIKCGDRLITGLTKQ